MMHHGRHPLTFTSALSLEHKPALDGLLFHNPAQSRVRDGIMKSINEFGQPRLICEGGELRIAVGEHEPQSLFAFDGTALAGFAVYLRTAQDQLSILHAGVALDAAGVLLALTDEVLRVCRRIVGIRRLVLPYRNGWSLNCEEHDAGDQSVAARSSLTSR